MERIHPAHTQDSMQIFNINYRKILYKNIKTVITYRYF